jgi:hypothetical protein
MAKRKSNGAYHPPLYGAYLFRDKDPSIDGLRTKIQDKFGRLDRKVLRQLQNNGGATVGCTSGWFFGKTMRPQNASLESTGRAAGFKRAWVDMSATEVWEATASAKVIAAKKKAAAARAK